MLGQLLWDTRHIGWLPGEYVPILAQELDERIFLFGVEVGPMVAVLVGSSRPSLTRLVRTADCMAFCLGSVAGMVGLRLATIFFTSSPSGFAIEVFYCGEGRLVAFVEDLVVPPDGEYAMRTRHLEYLVQVVGYCHELGEPWLSENGTVG